MAGTFLITGAGTGFGKEVALRLAEQGHEVIAGVEVIAQVNAVRAEARDRQVNLRVEKLDVTSSNDRRNAWSWDVDVLLNNAGVSEGGSTVDIPADHLRHQFEVKRVWADPAHTGFCQEDGHPTKRQDRFHVLGGGADHGPVHWRILGLQARG